MKIVSFVGQDTGGGGRSALRLHQGLRASGQESVLFMPANLFDDPDVALFVPEKDFRSRVSRLLRRPFVQRDRAFSEKVMARAGVHFGDSICQHGGSSLSQLPAADIVIGHCFYELCDVDTFLGTVPQRTPVITVLHTESLFTGGCAYSGSCTRYAESCGQCPQLESKRVNDVSRRIWAKKNKALQGVPAERLHFVSPSHWLAESARRSSMFRRFQISVIPHGLDTNTYAPRDRALARQIFEIPEDAFVILFLTQSSVQYKRKGLQILLEALRSLPPRRNLFLLSLGKGMLPEDLPIPARHLGSIHQDRILSYVYSAADVLAVPSLEEAFGLVVIESIACGTPVVAFDAGGIPDTVRPGVTGLLARAGDTLAFRDALLAIMSDETKRREMAIKCRQVAVAEYSLEAQAREYLKICESLAGK